jgi:drug/metabolite transporter (DMT)-like permease
MTGRTPASFLVPMVAHNERGQHRYPHSVLSPLPPARLILWIALLCLVWGSTWVVIADGLDRLPPFTSAAARFVVAALAMVVVVRVLGRREGGEAPPWWLSGTLGTLNFGASYAIVYWSETKLPSAVVSLLWGTFPLMMAAAGHLWLGERLRGRQLAGFALAFAGVVLLFAKDLGRFGDAALGWAALALASPFVSCIGTTLVKRHGSRVNSLRLNRDAMAIGAAWLLACAAWLERDAPAEWNARAIASVLYLALFGTVFTFATYFWLLRRTSAYQLSTIAYITPALAILLGAGVRGEAVGPWTLAGAGLVLGGVVLAVRSAKTSPTRSFPGRT